MRNYQALLSFIFSFSMLFLSMSMQSCSKYIVTTTENPADIVYKKKVMVTSFWGARNKPQWIADTCGHAGLAEVKMTTNFGYSLISVVSLGFVNLVKVEWKCHKPCPAIGFQP